MTLNYLKGLATLCAILAISLTSISQAGIFEAFVVTDFGGGNNYRSAANFDGHYYGFYRVGDTFLLKGAENQTFKNNASGNVCSGTLNYRIYKECETPGAFSTVTLDYCCDQSAPDCDGGTCSVPVAGAGFTNQKWRRTTETIDILAGLSKGEYILEVYMSATGSTVNNFDCSETLLFDNGGANYLAYFSIGSEGFHDGDFSANPAWTGDTGDFSVLDPTSLAGDGSNANINGAGVENAEVLVSNNGSTDAALATASTQAYGVWEFSVATGLNWSTSDVNNFVIPFISDTGDPTKLIVDGGTGAPDYNGYALKFKNSAGNLDKFVLVKQTSTVEVELLDFLYPQTASAYDGYTIRIVRDTDGEFSVYIDQGFDNTDANTLRGTVRDNDHTTSTHFAVVLNANSGGAARRLYFDNLMMGAGTELEFSLASVDVTEADSDFTHNLVVDIANPDPACETTADVVLISGDATRIGNYTTQSITFPAGSSASINVPVTISGNTSCQLNETLVFELQNVTGGCSAVTAGNKSQTMNLDDDESGTENDIKDDFEDGDASDWDNTTTWAAFSSAGTISGNYDLKHTGAVAAVDHCSYPLDNLELRGVETRWRWNHKAGFSGPSSNNWTMFMIVSDEADMFGGATNGSAGINNGYAVGTNFNGTNDELRFVRIDNGVYTDLINSGYLWTTTGAVGIEVVRDGAGNWEMKYQLGGGFDAMTSAGTVADATYLCAAHMGVGIEVTAGNAGSPRIDDVDIQQYGCHETWYSTGSGNTSAAIWSQNPLDVVGSTLVFGKFKSLVVQDDVVTSDADWLGRSLYVESSGTVNSSDRLKVYTDFTNDGSFDALTGTVEFKGKVTQQIGGTSTTTFNDMDINNEAGGVELVSPANLSGVMYPNQGTFDSNSQSFKLLSDGSGTASIAAVQSGADVQGDIDLQRHIPAGNQIWFNIGNPLTGATIADWDDDITTTGFTGADYEFVDYPFVNLFTYDETTTGDLDQGFTAPGNVTDALSTDKGYMVYLEAGSQDIETTGAVQKGDISQALDYTVDTGLGDDGWNLVVNRYPSEIDWEALYANSTGIGATYAVHDGDGYGGSRNYVFYDAISSSGTASRYIASSQSFWVKVDAAGGMLEWAESIKTQNGDPFERGLEVLPIVGFTLQGETSADHTYIVFDENMTMDYDLNRDAFHIGGGELLDDTEDAPVGLSSVLDNGFELSVNNFALESATSVPLKISVLSAQEVTLTIDRLEWLPSGICLSIEDLETGQIMVVDEDFEYSFTIEEYSGERFMLHFSTPWEVDHTDVSCFGSTDGTMEVDAQSEGSVDYLWFDEMGNLIFTDSNVDGSSEMTGLPFGNYEVQVVDETTICPTINVIVYVDQPSEESLNSESEFAMCNSEGGAWIGFDVEQSDNYDYVLTLDGEEVLTASGMDMPSMLEELNGAVYHLDVTTTCGTFSQEFDLTDPNAIEMSVSADDAEIYLEDDNNVILEITATNGDEYLWYLNGELVSESAMFTHIFTEAGTYQFSAHVFNSTLTCEAIDEIEIIVHSGANAIEELDQANIIMTWNVNEVFVNFDQIDQGTAIVRLINTVGQVVVSENFVVSSGSRESLETSGLSAGVYEVEVIMNDTQIFTGKVLK